MSSTQEITPRTEIAAIGFLAGVAAPADGYVVGYEVQGVLLGTSGYPFVGLVENLGDVDFTFSVEQSNNNGNGDAYAAINLRVLGVAVASVVVKPEGRVQFSIETRTKVFLKLRANTGYGRVALLHWTGELTRRERAGN